MESGIHRHGIRNPQRGIRNPRLSWITLHGAILGSIPPKFEHKLRRHKQIYGKMATTVVVDKDDNLL